MNVRWVSLWLFSTLGIVFGAAGSLACTTVALPQSILKVVGKSYDWNLGQGYVITNKRHVAKQALDFMPGDNPVSWVSRYGSLSFNQYGREFPNGGINEKGLMVEIMWLDSSTYPSPDGSPSINELQWIQYVLDNFQNVDEVVKAMPAIRVSKVYAPVHYMSCDRSGSCATFEYVDGQLVIHSGERVFVNTLTNDTYEDSVAYLKEHQGFGGDKEIPMEGTGSLPRFARAAYLSTLFQEKSGQSAIDYVFGVLDKVDQGDYTKWKIVYQTATGNVAFHTAGARDVKQIDASRFDFSCKAGVKMYDMNQHDKGDVTAKFVAYSRDVNRQLIQEGIKDLIPYLPPGTLDKLAAYPEILKCME